MTSPYWTGPATTYANVTGHRTIDAFTIGEFKWGTGGAGVGATVSYSFPSKGAAWTIAYSNYEPFSGFDPFTSAQQAAARKALGAWSAVADISFVEVADGRTNVGDIRFGNSAVVGDMGSAAWAYVPFYSFPESGDVWFDKGYKPNLQLGRGQFGYATMVHEIGHAIGLDHPFADGYGEVALPKALDNQRYTIMSYTPYSGATIKAYGPMLYDILAIQYIYGANMTTRAGNNDYKFTTSQEYFECIWDAGGHDTFDLSSQTRNQFIDLRAGSFSSIGIRNDGQAGVGNVSIAFNVTIEDAIGGAGNDMIGGNSAANRLRGGGGKDRVNGGEGDDRLEGDAGADVLKGGAGNDVLMGGSGNDTMEGGVGNDTYYIDEPGDVAIEKAGGGIDTICLNSSYVLGDGSVFENLTLLGSAKNGTGNADANTIIGNNAANLLKGQDGDDRLEGGAGSDLLVGGIGEDTLLGGSGNDTMQGGEGNDTYSINSIDDVVSEAGGNGVDTVYANFNFVLAIAGVENLGLVGTAISATGDAFDNVIIGNAEDNILDGAGGNDLLKGGAGNDTYIVNDAGDVVDEESNSDSNDTVKTSLSNATAFAGVETYIYTGAGAWTFTGDDNANKAIGDTLDDTLIGGLGDDYLDGQGGTDVLKGGGGNDTYVVDSLSDVVDEEANIDANDTVISSLLINAAIAGIESYSYIGADAWAFTGDSAVNNLSGGSSNDTLSGAAGNDTLAGNAGDDMLTGGADDDWLDGESGDDTLQGGAGNDRMDGGAGNDTLQGAAGNDWLDGGTGNDTLQGGAGNDTYVLDSLADVADEEANTDTGDMVKTSVLIATALAGIEHYTYTGARAWAFTGNADANWIIGGALNDILDGAAGNDGLVGNAGDDTLIGGLGDDYLYGGAGDDSLRGGAGNDTYVFDGGTIIDEAGNSDTDDLVRASVTVNLATLAGGLIEHAVLLGTAALNATGNGVSNQLTGNDGANVLNGGGGADILTGGLGDDTYIVNNLGDQVIEAVGGGTDLVKSSVTFSLAGQSADNLILTGSAAINGTGNALNNQLNGNDGANRLDGGAGDDTLVGGKGDDIYVVDSLGDVVNESVLNSNGGGIDTVESSIYNFSLRDHTNIENLTLVGNADFGIGNKLANVIIGNATSNYLTGNGGADTLIGGGGNDYLNGESANDVLRGGAGSDDIHGGSGNDTIWGGDSADYLRGDLGRDIFDYNLLSEGGDTIWSFEKGASGDVLDLRDLMDSIGYSGTDPVGDGVLSFVDEGYYVGTGVWVDADGAGAGAATKMALIGYVALSSTDTSNYLV